MEPVYEKEVMRFGEMKEEYSDKENKRKLQIMLKEKNERAEKLLRELEKQREEEHQKDRREIQLEIERIKEARQKYVERQRQGKREWMSRMMFTLTENVSWAKKKDGRRGAGGQRKSGFINSGQKSSDQKEAKTQEQEKLLPSPGPAEDPKSPTPSTAVPTTQPHTEENVRTESNTVPEELVPEPQTFSHTGSEQQAVESPDRASEDDELDVEVWDLTSQDSGTGKGNGPKYKSKRRRIIGWINKKMKEKYQKAIIKSLNKEEEHGHELFMTPKGLWMTEAQYQQAKRERLYLYEDWRQALETCWREWEEKQAQKKAEKKAKKEKK
ncbi:glutamic acid-rich protein-like [Colossoma macropomum]|uniref:glutamic acid-rich protein-like n=1 Tax=Colossoma macropomum TaxID=42526 RepID=UPI001863E41E|nr:glutamic acid-rich protein-like [Colossoma macropomum]